jgi:hypothetical protein
MARLSSLGTLSVVYPSSSGRFDFQTVVEPSAERCTPLRRLTDEEMAGLTIKADYEYDTWAGAFPVRWTANAAEHLAMVEGEMNRSCHPSSAGDLWPSSLWDDKANRLGIRYEARCFEPLPAREKFHL